MQLRLLRRGRRPAGAVITINALATSAVITAAVWVLLRRHLQLLLLRITTIDVPPAVESSRWRHTRQLIRLLDTRVGVVQLGQAQHRHAADVTPL